jgi:hypothetical protein
MSEPINKCHVINEEQREGRNDPGVFTLDDGKEIRSQ